MHNVLDDVRIGEAGLQRTRPRPVSEVLTAPGDWVTHVLVLEVVRNTLQERIHQNGVHLDRVELHDVVLGDLQINAAVLVFHLDVRRLPPYG